MIRSLTTALVAALAALTLAACTSTTSSCKDGVCNIDLSGKGAETQLGGEGGSMIKLVSASGDKAKVELAGSELELTVGQPVALSNGTLVLKEVEGEDDIQLEVRGAEPAETEGEGDAAE